MEMPEIQLNPVTIIFHALTELQKISEYISLGGTNKLMVTPEQAADMLSMHKSDIIELCKTNELRWRQRGTSKYYIIDVQSIIEYHNKVFSEDFICDNHFANKQGAINRGKRVTETECNKLGITPKKKRGAV